MSSSVTSPPIAQRDRRRAVVAATIGNFVEWYDYIIYGYFAAVIAEVFFPTSDPLTGLLTTFAAFGVAYFMRPLGALVLGSLGDRLGRRAVLSFVILIASGATFLIGCLPGYDRIGIAAPVILVIARLVQGFSAGGEYGGATAYMVEFAPARHRALYGSWQASTQGLAMLVGALLGATLTASLNEADLLSWGWRIPFLIALPLGFIGLYLRVKLSDTPSFAAAKEERTTESTPLAEVLRTERRSILVGIGIVTGWTTTTFLLIYLPTYIPKAFDYNATTALVGASVGLAIYAVGCPLVAIASDRIGRKPILLIATAGSAIWAIPAFTLLLTGNAAALILAHVGIGFVLAFYGSAGSTALAEMFPTSVRYTALSISYSVAVSLFGGFSPLIATFLLQQTGWAIAPAFYVATAGVIATIAATFLTESANKDLR